MHNPALAKDYEVPKKSMFLLEGKELVQSRDAAAYISNSVTDSVMCSTNGNLGLRHRSEIETVAFKTGVMLNGVYHTRPRETSIRCSALPSEYHLGASLCMVDINCLIDGDSGTLSSVPARRLSLEDGAYRSECEDVMSSDGNIMFDCEYVRTVGSSDLSSWAATVCYKNFRLEAEPTSGSERGGLGEEPGSPWSAFEHLSPSLDSNEYRNVGVGRPSPKPFTHESWRTEMVVTFSVDLSEWEVLKANQMDDIWQRSLTSNVLVNSMTEVSCVAHYPGAADGSPTTMSVTDGYNSGYVSSSGLGMPSTATAAGAAAGTTSPSVPIMSGGGITVTNSSGNNNVAAATPTPASTMTRPSSIAGSSTAAGPTTRRIAPEVSIITCAEDLDSAGSPLGLGRYSSPLMHDGSSFIPSEADGRAGGAGVGSVGLDGLYLGRGGSGPMGGSSNTNSGVGGGGGGGGRGGLGGGNGGRSVGDRLGSLMSSSLVNSPTHGGPSRSFVIRKRFVLTLTPDNVPSSIVLTFKGRHMAGNNDGNGIPRLASLPSLEEMIAGRKEALDRFWRTHEFDLKLQEELIPNRTKLALMNGSFRLFGVSGNLENGLSKSGCSCSGEPLQYDLRQYIYFGMYYIMTDPPSCLKLLRFLYRLLPQARTNARSLSVPLGALYPESTMTGINTKFYSNLMSARFHINADVGHLIHIYNYAVETISKKDRLALLEMMLETARIWVQLGEWRRCKTEFHLDNMAGVDEYNANGNGNFYLHLCSMRHMINAVNLLESEERVIGVDEVNKVLARIHMSREELDSMRCASKAIVLRSNEQVGAYMLHDHFDSLSPWDRNERAKHPLNLNYHPLAIFRHKVVDVPEVLLGMVKHEWMFDRNDFEKNLFYYAPLCTLDTPEAMALLAISLCRARENFAQPIPFVRSLLHLDLDNIAYLAEEGLHFSAMAAGMVAFMAGIGGVSFKDRCLYMNPLLPAGVNGYTFTICWQDAVIKTTLNSELLAYELVSGDSVRFIHGHACNRIHLHTGFRRCEAKLKVSIPRRSFSQVGQFDGAIILSDCLFHNLLEYSYVSWLRTLESLFENYRALHQRPISPLTPEEFINKVVYQTEAAEIAFSGIHRVLLDRNVNLEIGTPNDAEIVETRYGLANAKVAEMAELLVQRPPRVNPQLFKLVKALALSGVACSVVTYSRSLKQLMQHSKELANFFVARIDGEEAHDRRIKGRPHLDLYLRAAEKIHVDPSRCLVISHHLDRDYTAEKFAQFRMFLDVDDPFVSSRIAPQPYPTLSPEGVTATRRDNPVVCRLDLNNIPATIDELEDIIEGRPRKPKL